MDSNKNQAQFYTSIIKAAIHVKQGFNKLTEHHTTISITLTECLDIGLSSE